jgi:hypothetical protein
MGSPVGAVEPSGLVEMLAGYQAAVGLLALCSGERLSEVACSLTDLQPARRAVRTALDLGWESVTKVQTDPSVIGAAISDLEDLVNSPDFEVSEHQAELTSSVIAAAYALRAVRGDGAIAAANAIATCRDVYFQIAVRTWPRLDLDAWDNSPIVQEEIRREVREAQAIASLEGAIQAENVEFLRQAAHADSGALVGLLKGQGSADGERLPSGSQDPLF